VRVEPAPPAPSTDVRGEEIALDILWADEHVIAVNKPPGMVVHPAVGNRRGTLVNALLHHFPSTSWPGAPERAGIVHRLDRDTSGVILVALDVRAHEALAKQFRTRTVEKTYLALVRGDVKKAGRIDQPIGRHPRDRKRMSVVARRTRTAATDYRPLERFGVATLLEVRPHTGRTHQIRVHLAASGWPVLADPVYGGAVREVAGDVHKSDRAALDALRSMPRQALHARRIGFDHPFDGRRIEVEAPLAADIAAVLARLRGSVPDKGQSESG
jgi:23S rRNA pseudouridine1911/1915/1917 synthase